MLPSTIIGFTHLEPIGYKQSWTAHLEPSGCRQAMVLHLDPGGCWDVCWVQESVVGVEDVIQTVTGGTFFYVCESRWVCFFNLILFPYWLWWYGTFPIAKGCIYLILVSRVGLVVGFSTVLNIAFLAPLTAKWVCSALCGSYLFCFKSWTCVIRILS